MCEWFYFQINTSALNVCECNEFVKCCTVKHSATVRGLKYLTTCNHF